MSARLYMLPSPDPNLLTHYEYLERERRRHRRAAWLDQYVKPIFAGAMVAIALVLFGWMLSVS